MLLLITGLTKETKFKAGIHKFTMNEPAKQ